MSLVTLNPVIARDKFFTAPFAIQHALSDHSMFELSQLVSLAQSMPRDKVEFNSGKLAPGTKPEDVPQIDMPVADIIRHIEDTNAWMVLKNVEQVPEYQQILKSFLDDAARQAGVDPSLFSDLQGFIFISSANSVTPFHIDAEENILIQIKGDKYIHIFDNQDRTLISECDMELSPSKHRNQYYEPGFEQRATIYTMKENDGVRLPYMWPHWVRTGDRYSISMAMTWKTPEVLKLNKIRLMNGTLRRFGLPQAAPGVSPMQDAAKVVLHDAIGLVINPIRKSESMRKLLRGVIYGRAANYYYGANKRQPSQS
jgi:hypothetical protein